MSHKDFLDGRVVLVAGGSSGIGLATAQTVARSGARVVVTGRDEDRLRQAAEVLPQSATVRQADIRHPGAMRTLAGQLGHVDHLVLASGTSAGIGALADVDPDQVRDGLETKALGYLATLQAVLPVLGDGASVTLVGARSATVPAPGAAGLALINGAVEALVPTLAAELAPVRVNAVSPGVVDTPWWSTIPDDARSATFDGYASASAVGRVGRPDEVVAAIMALMTNGFMTGVVLPVDGGRAAA